MNRSTAAIAAILCLVSSLAWAHGKATGIVRERMDQMVVLKDAMKLLKAELTKGEAYDASAVIAAAKKIEDHSGAALTVKFPEGSLTKHSKALPDVWKDPGNFSALAHEMERLAGNLTASVEAGIPNVGADKGLFGWLSGDSNAAAENEQLSPFDTFGGIANVCSECHKDFRSE